MEKIPCPGMHQDNLWKGATSFSHLYSSHHQTPHPHHAHLRPYPPIFHTHFKRDQLSLRKFFVIKWFSRAWFFTETFQNVSIYLHKFPESESYVIEGWVKYVFDPLSFVRPISVNRPTNVLKKSPPQAKKIWGGAVKLAPFSIEQDLINQDLVVVPIFLRTVRPFFV